MFFLSRVRSEAMFVKAMEWTKCPSVRMEYLSCGDLCKQGIVGEEDARDIIREVLEGLQFMHGHRIAHLDMKPANIMVRQKPSQNGNPARPGDGWWIKLADFGVATYYCEQKDITPLGGPYGTVCFLSPDMLKLDTERPVASSLEQATKADIFAVGITMLVTAAQNVPFWHNPAHGEPLGLYNDYLSPFPAHPLTDDNLSHSARSFLYFLTQPLVQCRPTAADALAHPWLQPLPGPALFLRTVRTVFLDHQKILRIFFAADQTYLIIISKRLVTVLPLTSSGPATPIFHTAPGSKIRAVAPLVLGILTIYESTGTITRIHVLSRTVTATFRVVDPLHPPPATFHIAESPLFNRIALARDNVLTFVVGRRRSKEKEELTTFTDSMILGVRFVKTEEVEDCLVVATETGLHYMALSSEGEVDRPTMVLEGSYRVVYPGAVHSISIAPDGDVISMTTADGESWTTRAAWKCWRRGAQVAPGSEVFVQSSEPSSMVMVRGTRVAVVVKGEVGRDGAATVEFEEEDVAPWSGVSVAVGKGRVATGYVVVEAGGRVRSTCVRVREVLRG